MGQGGRTGGCPARTAPCASLPTTRCRGEQGLEGGPAARHSPGHDQLWKLYVLWDPGSACGITDVSIATTRVIRLNWPGPVLTGKNGVSQPFSRARGCFPLGQCAAHTCTPGSPRGQPSTSRDFGLLSTSPRLSTCIPDATVTARLCHLSLAVISPRVLCDTLLIYVHSLYLRPRLCPAAGPLPPLRVPLSQRWARVSLPEQVAC